MLQRAEIRKILAALGAPFSVPAHKVTCVEASTEMLRIRHELEESHFEGIATDDESWFQYFYPYPYPSSKIFARSPTDIIPRTRQAIGTEQNMITIFFTGRQLTALDILPKGSKFNQICFAHYIFSDLKREKREFRSADPAGDFVGTYGQLIVPQWIKSGITIRGVSCFTITAPTPFARYMPLRLLAL